MPPQHREISDRASYEVDFERTHDDTQIGSCHRIATQLVRKSGACFHENVAGSLEGHIPEEGTGERARELAGVLTRSALNSHCLHIAERATNLDQHEERSIIWLSGSCLSQLGQPISASI